MDRIYKIALGFCLLILFNLQLQAQLKPFGLEGENPWHHLYLLGVSKDSQWINYKTHGLNGNSVNAIKDLDSGNTITFEKSVWGSFSDNSNWYVANNNSGAINLTYLKSGKSESISNVKSSEFSGSNNYLIIQTRTDELKIKNLNTNQWIEPGFITSYTAHPAQEVLAMVVSHNAGESLRLLDLNTNEQMDIPNLPNTTFKNVTWNKKGNKLAFLCHSKTDNSLQIGLYDLNSKELQFFQNKNLTGSSSDIAIADEQLAMDEEGNKVFFYVSEKKSKNPESHNDDIPGIEVWDTFDPILYSRRKNNYNDRERPWLYVWIPAENKGVQLGNKDIPILVFDPNAEFGINFNPLDYEPQFHSNPYVDLYAINLKDAKRDLIVEKQFSGINFLSYAPDGNALAYFRNGNWWLYDVQKKTHTNLTAGVSVSFQDDYSPSCQTPQPHGLKGWSKDGKRLYIYDKYDVWSISVDGKSRQKLTQGREKNTVFRLVNGKHNDKTNYGNSSFDTTILNDENGLLFSAENKTNFSSGFYRWTNSKQLEEIVFKNKRLRNLYQLNEHSFVFQEESFDAPPAIKNINGESNNTTTVFQSNKDWHNYKWPERKMIYYRTPFADSLKGVLIYPVNFNPKKKYPMVVHVYEMQSSFINRFLPPNPFNNYGFNFMDYALNDYFVLLPDIVYQRNKLGPSATRCVETAIDQALQTAPIDAARIGLIGHSLGGYETAFILTQTDRFAAAVAGSGIFNLVSYYFGLYNISSYSEIFRVEQSIFRMKESFFENRDAYLENSPIHHFANITTPLLIWTGKQDNNVAPAQSMEGYMALRRLRKKGVMYLYENDGHVLNDIENQKHLSLQIKNWLDTHLKE